jgi:UDP-sulfoquinovose synthase
MRILVLGGDGYLGWPQSLYLSGKGHEIAIFDNFMRRQFDLEHGFDSITPIETLHQRVRVWHEISGKQILIYVGSTEDYDLLSSVFREFQPDAVIHFAEQRSAPYSMIDRKHAIVTQANNVLGTINLLYAIKDIVPSCHLVKLGTMGEYGTPNIDIEEGFLEIHHKGRTDTLPYPKQPGSWYHLSKVHDSHNIQFCCRVWGIRCTDLNQGVVYGVETDETRLDKRLSTRFDYDQIYGTALNRFCAQAAVRYPLTVYGEGERTRGYIHLQDTVRCIELAILSPPQSGEYRVFNQITEQFSILDLATMVVDEGRALGLSVRMNHIPNPRIGAEKHYYHVVHTRLLELGLQPHFLNEGVLRSLVKLATAYRERIHPKLITPTVYWRNVTNQLSQGGQAE